MFNNLLIKRNEFTLIELIVVIGILAILASVVMPNIKGVSNDASITAIKADRVNIETAVGMYQVDHSGGFPTLNEPMLGTPEPIDFTLLYPKYLRDLPQERELKYWVDYTGKVWISDVDTAANLIYEDGFVKWDTSNGAIAYQVFEVTEGVSGASKQQKIKFLENVTETTYPREGTKEYVVNAVSSKELETPPAGVGYSGFPTNYSVKETLSEKPEAIISVSPEENIDEGTNVVWNYDNSIIPEGLSIIDEEWENKKSTYEVGEHTIRLRLKGDNGVWSDWTEKTITVNEFMQATVSGTNTWEVPVTGKYKIEVYGGKGGKGGSRLNSTGTVVYSGYNGKYGYYQIGEFLINAGEILYMKEGAQGANGISSFTRTTGGKGGGESYVILNGNKIISAKGGTGGDGRATFDSGRSAGQIGLGTNFNSGTNKLSGLGNKNGYVNITRIR